MRYLIFQEQISPIIDRQLRHMVADLDAAAALIESADLFSDSDDVCLSPDEAADILRAITAAADALYDFRDGVVS